ncbi:uncharacterized protein G2W53_044122 [Senna tora]|uniref:Uncharacterized protein n=1 Tax=Senna tora TaxID=362788 RepID=A0A834W430_9FABA|nr:uncharacterized protein G2W53_044122 [Senna tora]
METTSVEKDKCGYIRNSDRDIKGNYKLRKRKGDTPQTQ